MKAVCPNSEKHTRFITTAKVVQEWEVDQEGNFLSCISPSMEAIEGPNPERTWNCSECGAFAEVSE